MVILQRCKDMLCCYVPLPVRILLASRSKFLMMWYSVVVHVLHSLRASFLIKASDLKCVSLKNQTDKP